MRAIDLFLKNIAILFSLAWLHGHGIVLAENGKGPADTIATAIPQQRGNGGGGNPPPSPSGMTTVVLSRLASPPSSPNQPSQAKPTSDTHHDLRRDDKLLLSPQEAQRRPRQAPAAPPVDSNSPPPTPPSPPSITPGPTLPKGPEYITSEEDMNAGAGTYSGIDANGNPFRFVQTTYYSCVTRDTTAHCGWHRPIVNVVYGAGGTSAAPSWKLPDIAARAIGIACLVGGILVVRN